MLNSIRPKLVITVNTVVFVVLLILIYLDREQILNMLDPRSEAIVGTPAPEFADGTWINSPPLTMKSLRGKVVVLDFWTFKCGNCLRVLPMLSDWHREYRGRDIVFIAVHSPETAEEANVDSLRAFLAGSRFEFPVLVDTSMTTWNRYRAQFWPSTFIIDKHGNIRDFHFGEIGFSFLKGDIEELLDDSSI